MLGFLDWVTQTLSHKLYFRNTSFINFYFTKCMVLNCSLFSSYTAGKLCPSSLLGFLADLIIKLR